MTYLPNGTPDDPSIVIWNDAIPVAYLASLTGPHADTIARIVTGQFVDRQTRDEPTAPVDGQCLTVEEWRQRQDRDACECRSCLYGNPPHGQVTP